MNERIDILKLILNIFFFLFGLYYVIGIFIGIIVCRHMNNPDDETAERHYYYVKYKLERFIEICQNCSFCPAWGDE